eukprot:4619866-Prymnesium_polylepis.1
MLRGRARRARLQAEQIAAEEKALLMAHAESSARRRTEQRLAAGAKTVARHNAAEIRCAAWRATPPRL